MNESTHKAMESPDTPQDPNRLHQIFNINTDDFPHQDLDKLRHDIGCPDSGEDKDSSLYKCILHYTLTFISKEGFQGTKLFRLQEQGHRDGLFQMVNDFLEKEGNGARFWPSAMTDENYRGLTYAEHSGRIKRFLVQIFWKINYLRELNKKTGISPRRKSRDPKHTAPPNSFIPDSSSNDTKSGHDVKKPICVGDLGPSLGLSIDTVTSQDFSTDTNSVQPRQKSSTFEPNESPFNDYGIQDTSEGLGTPRRSVPRAPEAPMAEADIETPSPGRSSATKRGRGRAKRSAPVVGRKSETTKAKRAKHASTTSPTATAMDPADGPAVDSSSESFVSAPNPTRQRVQTQHPGMVSWQHISLGNTPGFITGGQSPVPSEGQKEQQPLIRDSNPPSRPASHLHAPPNAVENTTETMGGQAGDVPAQTLSENQAQGTQERLSQSHSPELGDQELQMFQPTVESIPDHQPEPEVQPTHARGSGQPERNIETLDHVMGKAPLRGSESVLKQAADPEHSSRSRISEADQNDWPPVKLDPVFRVYTTPKKRVTWELQGRFQLITLVQLLDALPIEDNFNFSGVSFTLEFLDETCEDHISVNDENKFRVMKAWFNKALYEASKQVASNNESVLTFQIHITPKWVGKIQGQTGEGVLVKTSLY